MKILIVYTSKTGTTEECVSRLCTELTGKDVTLCNITSKPQSSVTLDGYDIVIAGGSVRFGKLNKNLRAFLTLRREELLRKKLGLFLVCGEAHESEYYTETLFPKELVEATFQTLYFGGSLRPPKASWLERRLLSHIRTSIAESEINDGEYTPSMPGILPENISRMASYVKSFY